MSDQYVYLAQLLCPERHCILAFAGQYDSLEAAQGELQARVQEAFDVAVGRKLFNPWCGICHSERLHIEVGRTNFRTIEEAMPTLQASALAQIAAAEYLKGSRN